MYSARPGAPGSNRGRLLRRMCILAGITLLVSVISIIIGVISMILSGSKFPYNVGGGMIAGLPAFLLAFCPFYMFYDARKNDEKTGCFLGCTILMTAWFCITILAIPIGFGMSGIYGIVSCMGDTVKSDVCLENAGAKFALSLMTIFITIILFVLTLAIFLTCCCNSPTFGIPLWDSSSDRNLIYYTSRDIDRPSNYSYDNPQMRTVRSAVSGSRRREELRPQRATRNTIPERNVRESSALPIGGDWDIFPDDEFYIATGRVSPYGSYAHRYADPPPSYEDSLKNCPSETTV